MKEQIQQKSLFYSILTGLIVIIGIYALAYCGDIAREKLISKSIKEDRLEIKEEKIANAEKYLLYKTVTKSDTLKKISLKTSKLKDKKYTFYKLTGKIDRAYFYIEASIDNNRLLSIDWNESVNLSIKNDKENNVGFFSKYGILDDANTEDIPKEDIVAKNIFLYNLNQVVFKSCEFGNKILCTKAALFENLLEKINTEEKIGLNIKINSVRGNKKIMGYISYICDQSTPDCSIESV
jgi:hypothetical protein